MPRPVSESEKVATSMAYRKVLPLAISEKLVDLVAEHVRLHLVETHNLDPALADAMSIAGRERAIVDLVDQAGRASDMKAFAGHLHRDGKLTPSLLLRALARGQMALFEHAVAELASTPHQRAWLMVHDAGPLGFKAIYDRAGLPPRLFQAFRAGVDTWRTLQAEGADTAGEDFRQRMLQRFLTQRPNAPRDDLAYLLERLDQAPVILTTIRDAA